MKLYSVLLGWTGTDQALRVAAGFHGSMRLTGGGLWPLLSGVWSLPGNVANLAASSWGSARIGEYGQTTKRSKASSQESSHTRLIKAERCSNPRDVINNQRFSRLADLEVEVVEQRIFNRGSGAMTGGRPKLTAAFLPESVYAKDSD